TTLFRSGFFADHRFLGRRRHFDRALTERLCGSRCDVRRPVNRAAFYMNALLAQMHLLLNGLLDHVATHPHATPADFALPDPKLLLVNRDDLFLMTRGTSRRSIGTRAGPGSRCCSTRQRGALALPGRVTLMDAGPAALAPVGGMRFDV